MHVKLWCSTTYRLNSREEVVQLARTQLQSCSLTGHYLCPITTPVCVFSLHAFSVKLRSAVLIMRQATVTGASLPPTPVSALKPLKKLKKPEYQRVGVIDQ